MNSSWLDPTTLKGTYVTLAPMEASHRDGLLTAAADGKLWELWYTQVPGETTIDAYMEAAFEMMENGTGLPYVVIYNETNTIIGSTRYCSAEPHNKRVEIGYTWYARSFQRTAVNAECKLLLLTQAFESLSCIAVEFKTHFHNHPSRNAILRLGAKQDGILRNHRIGPDGIIRDTVIFSILNTEWAGVKQSLEARLTSYTSS